MDSRWTVHYRGGRSLAQNDCHAPEFRQLADHPHGGEVPSSRIAWDQVEVVEFKSDLAESRFAWQDPGPAYRSELRVRTMVHRGLTLRWFVLVLYRAEAVIDPALAQTMVDATVSVTYWMPDGYTHQCTEFNCTDMDRYAIDWLQQVHDLLAAAHSESA